MLPGFLRVLWGDLSKDELKKFSLLSCIITLILGNYWMLRVLKNPIFNELVGLEYQPYAKIASIFVVAFIVLVYSKLVDIFSKQALFDIICSFYAALFFLVGFATLYPNLFAISESSSLYPFVQWLPGKFVGWVSYFTFESSSLMIILFWAFVASVTKPESAKKGYAMVVTCTQIGTITGTAVVSTFATTLGAPAIVGIGGILALIIPFIVRIYNKAIPGEDVDPAVANKKKPKTGFFEGLNLIATRPYVMGILVVSTIYEIVATILEFQMHMIAKDVFNSRDLYAQFVGKFGMSVNTLALVFALLGTSFFMRRFGLRFCLVSFPVIVGIALIGLLGINFYGVNEIQLMWALFTAMVVIKGFSYALNNPTKEVMYIPTTKDIKFKAKGWIESFGGRSAKGTGSAVTAQFAKNMPALLLYGTIISLGIVGVWLLVASILGKKFNKLQETQTTVQ